ncbi:MAG: tubulin/FtsZ family protein [Methanoregulaceae archaeon]|nr:tubulin/FtsZ family protein [Methanoregulaceae archaeon]
MEILAIGLGGAGCRIVEALVSYDRRSGNGTIINAIAVDRDAGDLNLLAGFRAGEKLYVSPPDPSVPEDAQQAAVEELIGRIHSIDVAGIDAIIICSGTGGAMIDLAPVLIGALRKTTLEPIFGLLTLPCLDEGQERSAKAADDLDALDPILDGIILFDNETWYRKAMAKLEVTGSPVISLVEKITVTKGGNNQKSRMNRLLNDAIVRRIGLLLRAGEFREGSKIEVGEVVLDAGEVLNTIRGMGFITIGYAAEPIARKFINPLSRLRSDFLVERGHSQAARIVELAKRAAYEEVSTPCDLTSAQKALVLIAGPSHELSMKGFMAVRKWIDRSIAGMELRSGDYPVRSTGFIGIVIVLAGLGNIPRLSEIRKIRDDRLDAQEKNEF